jgi:hypothetical protein
MKPLEWEDRFILLGKAVRLTDRPEYETTVAGFENGCKLVTLHHANAQSMDDLSKKYEFYNEGKWQKIGKYKYVVEYRHSMPGDYFGPVNNIVYKSMDVYGMNRAHATSIFFERVKDEKGEFNIKSVELFVPEEV